MGNPGIGGGLSGLGGPAGGLGGFGGLGGPGGLGGHPYGKGLGCSHAHACSSSLKKEKSPSSHRYAACDRHPSARTSQSQQA